MTVQHLAYKLRGLVLFGLIGYYRHALARTVQDSSCPLYSAVPGSAILQRGIEVDTNTGIEHETTKGVLLDRSDRAQVESTQKVEKTSRSLSLAWSPDGEQLLNKLRASKHSVCDSATNRAAMLYMLDDINICGNSTQMASIRETHLGNNGAGILTLTTNCDIPTDTHAFQKLLAGAGTQWGHASGKLQIKNDCVDVGEDTILVINPRVEYFGNIYHNMEEVFAMYETVDVLQRPLSDFRALFVYDSEDTMQVLQLDGQLSSQSASRLRPKIIRQTVELWSHMFARQNEKQKFHPLPGSISKSRGLCFHNEVVLPMRACMGGVLTKTWLRGADVRELNPLARMYARRVLDRFGIDTISDKKMQATQEEKLRVTLVMRNNKTRQLSNNSVNAFIANLQHMTVDALDFATLTYEEQIRQVRSSDLLIGAHGSGLTHLIWLPKGKGVIEITEWPPPVYGPFDIDGHWGASVANIYMNMAAWVGVKYQAVQGRREGNLFQRLFFSSDRVLEFDSQSVASAANELMRHA